MLNVNIKLLSSVQLHEDLVLEKLSFRAGESLSSVLRAAVGARSRRLAQSPVVLDAVMRALEKQTR